MPDAPKSPLDQVLDLLFYAPLGLAMTARDELPKLIEKGRQQTTNQITVAKMIGQFAVTQGQKEVTSRLEGLANRSPKPAAAPPAPPTPPAAVDTDAPVVPITSGPSRNGSEPGTGHPANGSSPPGPAVETLAIPGYDSLSAPQVVQRLAGLAPAELQAVGAYEEANRGRRTILSKVAMLQSEQG